MPDDTQSTDWTAFTKAQAAKSAQVRAERKRQALLNDILPLFLSTDLGSLHVLIRKRDDWGLGLPDAAAPFVAQIETFGGYGQHAGTIPLTLEHVQRIHTALGAFLADLPDEHPHEFQRPAPADDED